MLIGMYAYAQSNYFKTSYALGIGPNYSFTDVENGGIGYSLNGNFDLHFTPFISFGIEAQHGIVRGGNILTDRWSREFTNNYTSFAAKARFSLGEFVNYDRSDLLYNLKGLYVGGGLGFINNNITKVVRYRPNTVTPEMPLGYKFPGEDKTLNTWIPIDFGLNYFIEDSWGYIRYGIDARYTTSFCVGEGLDGYHDSSAIFKNDAIDQFHAFSITFHYWFGKISVYRKSL
ncbi:hypothetical protein [Pedobacter sp. MW01-1-1]|uniref:hypothetical protein n=1 Tax=Pedobacter sp. MW01-1-1 TaxID=3383027 RepID=UPI003FEFE160